MDLRKVFLKPLKRLKSKLPDGRRKRDGGSGSERDRKGGETDDGGSEASQSNSFLHSEVDARSTVESGPSQERNNVDRNEAGPVDGPPTSTPSISQGGKPDGMWAMFFQLRL